MGSGVSHPAGRFRLYGASDPWLDELTGSNMVAGILVGYALMFVFQAGIVGYHLAPWIAAHYSGEDIAPEAFLSAGSHSLVAMMITGAIIMSAFGPRGWTEHTALQEWYGYNNVCLVLDSPPSKYVMPTFYFLTGCYFVCYSVHDTMRASKLTYMPKWIRIFSGIVNTLAVFVWAFFSVCLAVGPMDDMVAHTVPFICMIFTWALIYVCHWLQINPDDRSWTYTSFLWLFVAVSMVKAALDIVALSGPHLDPRHAQFIDFLWMGLVGPLGFLSPPPRVPGWAPADFYAKRQAHQAAAFATPAILLLFPVVLVSVLWSVLWGAALRLVWSLGLYRNTPNVAPRRLSSTVSSRYTISAKVAAGGSSSSSSGEGGGGGGAQGKGNAIETETETESESTALTISRIPVARGYFGDIFGFLAFAKGWQSMFGTDMATHGPVFATNVGCPVLAAMDAESAQTILRNVDILHVAHAGILTKPSMPENAFNFARKGAEAAAVRNFHRALMPSGGVNDPRFVAAIEAMRAQLDRVASLDARQLAASKLVDLVSRLMVAFTSTLYLGKPLDYDLVDDIFPVPQFLPVYPTLLPTALLPAYYKMTVAYWNLFQQMTSCPNWPAVQKAAAAAGLDDKQACHAIFTGFTVNAAGNHMPLANAFFLLPLFPEGGRELLRPENTSLLNSFCWELLRHNGPTIMRQFDDPTIVTSSSGKSFHCRAGTKVVAQLGLAMRDPAVWANPELFVADRFVAALTASSASLGSPTAAAATTCPMLFAASSRDPTTGIEPLPVLCFGAPLGRLLDPQQQASSHQCIFALLAQPLLVEFVKMLVSGYVFRLDQASAGFLRKVTGIARGGASGGAGAGAGTGTDKSSESAVLAVDLGADYVLGKTGKEFMPRIVEKTTFGTFTKKLAKGSFPK